MLARKKGERIMKNVIIIRGGYGYRPDANGPVNLVTAKDGAISVADEEAARLVGLGVAEYAKDTKDVEGSLDPGDLGTYAYNDLKKLAKEMGLSASGSKEELIKRISEAKLSVSEESEDEGSKDEESKDMESESDDEEPPVLEAAEPEV